MKSAQEWVEWDRDENDCKYICSCEDDKYIEFIEMIQKDAIESTIARIQQWNSNTLDQMAFGSNMEFIKR